MTTVTDTKSDMNSGDRLLIVSIDSHCGPEPSQLRPFCEKKHLEEFDTWALSLKSEDDQLREALRISEDAPEVEADNEDPYAPRHTSGNTDMAERLRHMDEDGVVAEVIFHGGQNGQLIPFSDYTLLSNPSSLDVSKTALDLRGVGYHIYNRWLADWIAGTPERHVGVAHVPFWNVEAAVAEIEWAREAGLTSVNFPSPNDKLDPYNAPSWEPLWSACEGLTMPLSSHNGYAPGDYRGLESIALILMEAPFFGRRSVWYLIFGGVFERHPGLKLVITEQMWDYALLDDMDSAYYANPADKDVSTAEVYVRLRKALPQKPSEYFARNCFIGGSFLSNLEARQALEHGLTDNAMWGSDYPHMEGTWPNTHLSLRKTFAGIPHQATQKILGGNAMDVYGLDAEKLAKLAARIGPTVEKLDQPLEGVPVEQPGFAFHERGKWS